MVEEVAQIIGYKHKSPVKMALLIGKKPRSALVASVRATAGDGDQLAMLNPL